MDQCVNLTPARYSNAQFHRFNIYIDQKLYMWCPDKYFKLFFCSPNLFIYSKRIRERSKRPEITGIDYKQKKVQSFE